MKINTSLGKIQFEIELKAIEGSEQQSERNRLAALNIIAHSVGSKFRPESYSQENADKLESVLDEKLGKLFSIVNYSPSEWFAKETMSLSLKGMSAEFIAEMKKLVEAEKSKGKPGVILVQVENEYDFAKFPDKVKIRHIKALVESARGYGIEVPLITCWTHAN